jgi:homoserine dehydrogenase
VDAASPLGRLSGTDNLVEFHTLWYNPNPLVVQGRGAGAEVTASGVLSDIVELAFTT